MSKPRILLIYTGGTIGMIKDYETNALKAFNFDRILEKIPELQQLNCSINTISFQKPIDSSNMNVDHYIRIVDIIEVNYSIYDGFVVLTGSDTMSYTSSAISFMLEGLQKPVIFTGSQLPIGDLRTDAKENLITSIEIAATQKDGKPVIKEVGLYFEYKLYRANRTSKINAEQFEAFTSLNYPPLAESGVHLNFNDSFIKKTNDFETKLFVHKNLNTNIVILKLFPSIQKNSVEQILAIPFLKGVILETYGAGNAMTSSWFLEAIQTAVNTNVHVVNVTQCLGGKVLLGHYETSSVLKSMKIIDGKDITTESAIAKMMYLLPKKLSKEEFKKAFEKSLRGEISES